MRNMENIFFLLFLAAIIYILSLRDIHILKREKEAVAADGEKSYEVHQIIHQNCCYQYSHFC